MTKYKNLIDNFPDDVIAQAYKALEESDDAYKEFLLTICHEYGMELLNKFWVILNKHADLISARFTLEELNEYARPTEETDGELQRVEGNSD